MIKNFPFWGYVALLSYLIPPIVGFNRWKTLNSYSKFFSVFCLFSLLYVAVEHVLAMHKTHNLTFADYFRLTEFETIIFLYYKSIQSKKIKDALQIIGMIYLMYWLLEITYLEIPDKFQEQIAVSASLLFIIASLFIFYELTMSTEHSLFNHSVSWIATGVTLYSAGTIVVFAMSNVVLQMGMQYFEVMWHINWGFIILSNILYARSFLCKIF